MIGLEVGFFFFQAEDGIRDKLVTGVQTCALPISRVRDSRFERALVRRDRFVPEAEPNENVGWHVLRMRSEEHTSELQSLAYLVCRLLLEKKKNINTK